MPVHVKMAEDQSLYYEKPLKEMSRQEIAELQQDMEDHDNPTFLDDDVVRQSPEFLDLQRQMENIVPLRHKWIKAYFDKYKNQPKKREMILDAAEESEQYTKLVLGEEKYVHFMDAIPEIKDFMDSLQEENVGQIEETEDKGGKDSNVFTISSAIKGSVETTTQASDPFSMKNFNPFDSEQRKKQDQLVRDAFNVSKQEMAESQSIKDQKKEDQ
jgi:hypothetical protein